MTRKSLRSSPPSAVCAGFFSTKFGNYCTLCNCQLQAIKIPFLLVPIGLCISSLPHLTRIVYQDLSSGLKAKHMLKAIKKPCQIAHYKFWNWCKKVWADKTAYYEIEMHPFLSQLYKMVTFKNLELAANGFHSLNQNI